MLAAGKMDARITLQRPTETRGTTYSDVQKAWADVATVWAQYLPLSGRELLLAQQVNTETTARFVIRRRTDVTAKWRVLYRGRVFQITALPRPEGERSDRLTLDVTEARGA